MERTGYLKVGALGLGKDVFPFGSFGSDHADRYELPAIAVERAKTHTGIDFKGQDVVIIGDTRHDILCGESLGVFSVAVATGHYDASDLRQYNPHLLLEDLSDHDAFINGVLGT